MNQNKERSLNHLKNGDGWPSTDVLMVVRRVGEEEGGLEGRHCRRVWGRTEHRGRMGLK